MINLPFLSRLFGPPAPFNTGYLPEKDGHRVYFQQFGNPHGVPVLCFHGGPGSCGKPKHAQAFDLKKHHVVLFDQRGGGLSLPAGETRNNTADDLIADAARLLDHLHIPAAHVYGGSWGATLALLFAQAFPARVMKMIVAQTFLARRADVDWIVAQTARLYPDIMDRLRQNMPKGISLRQHYATLAASPDPAAQAEAARLYGSYERMIGSLTPAFPEAAPDEGHIAAFRLYMHYDSLDYTLAENRILDHAHVIENIPMLIVHNRLDMVCPPDQSYALHRVMKKSKLVIVPDRGHVSDRLYKTIRRETALFL